MGDQEHIQKQPQATDANQSEHKGFATRGFGEQIEQQIASARPPQDLKTQLSRAERFGHSLSKMSLPMAARPTIGAPSGSGNQTIQRAEPEEDDDQLQTKSENTAQLSTQSQSISQAASTESANSLPKPVRAKMEKAFGTSFSDVRVQTESPQAKSIGALAYTQGSQIHFAPGQYNPNSSSGQALLGHELTHVVQQRAGRVPRPMQSKGLSINADPALEQEADRLGAKAAQGQHVQVPGMTVGSALPIQHSTQPVQDRGLGSSLDGSGSKGFPTMDLNTYKILNQQVESLLPKLQQQAMPESIPEGMQNAVQLAKGGGGGGGKAGGMMSKLNPMSKILGK